MNSFRNISTIALYEAKMLWRSWFFRIFAGVILILLIGLNLLIFSVGQFPTWVFRGIPANIPYATVLLINLVQSIIAVILASDFMKRDRSMDTTDVVYIRSMTNTSYVLGKACGNLMLFIFLDAAALLCAALFNFLSGDVPVRLAAYCYYELLISLPTLVFCVGLTFFIMSIIRSQPLSLVALFGLLGLAFFFLPGRLFSIFDFAALRTPFMFSDVIGFGSTGRIIVIRSMYLLIGIALTLSTALQLKRLPQSPIVSRATLIAALLFGCVGLISGTLYVQGNLRNQKSRIHMIERHNRQFGESCVSVAKDDLSIQHAGTTINATARMTLRNETGGPIGEYQFRLNPGLSIREIRGVHPMSFSRNLDYVFVKPINPLSSGAIDTVIFSYAGSIDESACYLDVPPEELALADAVYFFQKHSTPAIINKRMVVLTPESDYYPQAGPGYCSDHPEVNFTALSQFSLSIRTDRELTVVSQGTPERKADGTWVFTPSAAMPGITVIIGVYARQSMVVDSVEYSLLTLAHHDYFRPFFKNIQTDTVASVIRGLKADFENRLKFSYPYSQFSIVEVPLQFTDFSRVWTSGHEAVQPEMVLFPENGFSLSDADFKAIRLSSLNRRGRDEVVTPQEQQTLMLQRFITSTFIRDNTGRLITLRPVDRAGPAAQMLQWLPPLSAKNADLFIFPEYFSYVVHVLAPICPVFSQALEAYYKKRANGDAAEMLRGFMGGATVDERVNVALQNHGFDSICKDPQNRLLVPDVTRKLGDYLFTVLQKNIGDPAFDDFMQGVVRKNRFGTIDLEDFCVTVKKRFAFDFLPYLQSCYAKRLLPGYLLDNIVANEVRDKTANRFKVRFEISNPESAQGIVRVSVRTRTLGGGRFGGGFPGGNRGGFPGSDASIDRIIMLAPRQNKEIDIMMDKTPGMLTVNTLISKNIPATLAHPFDKVEFDAEQAPFDGERIMEETTAPDPGIIIIDDEDSGFSIENKSSSAGILNWFRGPSEKERFAGMRMFDPPAEWTEAAGPQYYGKYVHSVHYIKAGGGKKRVAWRALIKAGGTYEIFAYYGAMGFQRGNGRGRNRELLSGVYHYIVHHDDGIENATLDFKDIQNGWNSLGRYHLSPGGALVELTDQGSQGAVFGDAIKWEKQ